MHPAKRLVLTTAALTVALALLPPVDAAAQGVGVVEGVVTLQTGPTRRTASRYPSGVASARGMQRVSPVVYLEAAGSEAAGPAGAPTATSSTMDVLQRDTLFAPSAIVVRTGTVVRFPNADPFFHNVYSYSPNVRFDLGRYPPGESREVRFDRPGVARVFCEVHEFMRAVVVVTDLPFAAVVGEDGAFRITGVPPGQYRLVAYHPDAGAIERDVSVGAGGTVRMDVTLGG